MRTLLLLAASASLVVSETFPSSDSVEVWANVLDEKFLELTQGQTDITKSDLFKRVSKF